MNIGIFDSGLGGLSIFREILTVLPEYNYLYLGDNARVPYGGRSAELIFQFTKNAVQFLFEQDCQLIILACNAATANALRRLQQEYLPSLYPNRHIVGIIRPVVEQAASLHLKTIGVMGTRATIASDSYPKELAKLSPETHVYQIACPLLVPIIEEDELEWEGLDSIIQRYLAQLLSHNVDGLILGCTHYGLIIDQIKKHVPPTTQIISQGKATAAKLVTYLIQHPEITKQLATKSQRTFFATDLNQRYEKLTKLFLGDIGEEVNVKLIQL